MGFRQKNALEYCVRARSGTVSIADVTGARHSGARAPGRRFANWEKVHDARSGRLHRPWPDGARFYPQAQREGLSSGRLRHRRGENQDGIGMGRDAGEKRRRSCASLRHYPRQRHQPDLGQIRGRRCGAGSERHRGGRARRGKNPRRSFDYGPRDDAADRVRARRALRHDVRRRSGVGRSGRRPGRNAGDHGGRRRGGDRPRRAAPARSRQDDPYGAGRDRAGRRSSSTRRSC